ncbi:hypothetical protein LCGC14_2243030 [marine sediment metagenome]|uniref:NAD-dependent epimerase/dehydratase domain-containing protein n=1 Tax=marine sediment metagenome TaxID=412755 RepID=A0A0F9D4J0_9ZZZZ
MRIGITGWRGFIGSYLKDKIENPILFQGNLKQLGDVKAFTKSCDRIYHIAGKNKGDDGNILSNNLVSTGNLILALKLQSINPEIVFVSPKQVEGHRNSEYGLVKWIEEGIIHRANKWCIFGVPNVYGANGRPFYNSVVATFAYQLSHGQEVTIDDPNDTREFIFVEDLVGRLLKPEFSVYVPIEGEVMSIKEVYEYLTTKLGEHENLKKCLDYWREHVPHT